MAVVVAIADIAITVRGRVATSVLTQPEDRGQCKNYFSYSREID